MLYPKFLKEKSTIGITAPSSGVGDYLESFEKSLNTLKKSGYETMETESVRNKGVTSASGKKRAEELDELITNDNIDLVMCASGGDFLIEMLPYVN